MLVNVTTAQDVRRPKRLPRSPQFVRVVCSLAVVFLSAVTVNAQSPAAIEILRGAFLDQDFAVKSFGPVRWLNGGLSYTTLEPSAGGEGATDLVRYDTATAQREVLVSAKQLTLPDGKKPIPIENYALAADMNRVLILTNSKRVWRENTRGDYWVRDRKSGTLKKLGDGGPPPLLCLQSSHPTEREWLMCVSTIFMLKISKAERSRG